MQTDPGSPPATSAQRVSDSVTVAAEPLDVPLPLQHIDRGFTWASVGILVLLGVAIRRRGLEVVRKFAPERRSSLREDAIAWAVLGYFGTALVITGVLQRLQISTDGFPGNMALGSGAHLGGIAACLVIAAYRFEGGVGGFILGPAPVPMVRWLSMVGTLAVLALGICPVIRDATVWTLTTFWPDWTPPAHQTLAALHDPSISWWMVTALWVGAAAVAPAAEELFFRGLMQTFVLQRTGSRWCAILLTSTVFAGVHWSQTHAVAALGLLAVLLGYAYERTGSLIPPLLIHMLFNLKTLVWDAFIERG